MPNDYKHKEPSKTEKVLYELAMRLEMQDRSLMTNSALICSLAMALDVKPEKLAELLITGNDKIKDYSKQLNDEIGKLEKDRKAEHNHEHHDHEHDHGHDHTPEATENSAPETTEESK